MTHEQPKNRNRALFWLTPLIAAAVCAAAIGLFLNGARKNDAAPRMATEAARLAALEEQLQRSNAALRRLEQVQLVQAAAAAERTAHPVVKQEPAAANEPPAEELATEDGPQAPYPEEREKAFFSAYFSELEVAMSHQRPDRQVAAQLMSLVPGVDSGLVRVLDLKCTEQFCRLEAEYQHADRASRGRFIDDLQSAFAPVLTRASIHLPTDEKRLVGYFAKKGATLPRPTTSFAASMRGDER